MEETKVEYEEEYEPFLHDIIFHGLILFMSIICPSYYYRRTPNLVIFAKSQLFCPPSVLPWQYTSETMELISQAKNLSDQFYLDLFWRQDTDDEKAIRLRELNRIRDIRRTAMSGN